MTDKDICVIHNHFSVPPTFVLCPQSNNYISGLRPPVELLLRHNAKVAIGTDSLASNDNLSIIEELKQLPEVPLAKRIEWATMGGAEALDLDSEIGSLEVGKRAGIVLIEGLEERDGALQLSTTARSRRLV